MAYRNKTYICFDADTDIRTYRMMQAWNENENIAFNFHNAHELNNLRPFSNEETIKRKLRERMLNSSVAIVLVGNNTKNLYKFVRWEIELAINLDLPIIVVNLNYKKHMDSDLCPEILRNHLAIHVAYGQKIINYALNHWPDSYNKRKRNGDTSTYVYKMSVYKELYPDFMQRIYLLEDSDEFHAI